MSELAVHLPLTNDLEELIQRLSRSLDNAELTWHRSYGQVVRHLFTHWQGEEVALVMDRTDLGQEQSILTVGAAYHKACCPRLAHFALWRYRCPGTTQFAPASATLSTAACPHAYSLLW
ncbi:MAG: hypothetical protein U0175_09340 [Caldilineaceae bacterium]